MLLIAFLGGILTILSPCILPVVPFLFARANRSRGSVLLTLAGMVLTFALVSSLAVVCSEWVVRASSVGRQVALWVMVLFARSEEHTSELQSLMRISYAVFCLKKKNKQYSESYHTSSTYNTY